MKKNWILTADFAERFNEHHRVVIEISALGLGQLHLAKNHHEGLIKHLLLQKVLNDGPLQTMLLIFIITHHSSRLLIAKGVLHLVW